MSAPAAEAARPGQEATSAPGAGRGIAFMLLAVGLFEIGRAHV